MTTGTYLVIMLVALASYVAGSRRQAKHDLDVARRKLGPYATKMNSISKSDHLKGSRT